MVVDEPDDMETVGHDAGVGEVFLGYRPIGAGQVHAYQPHQVFALQTIDIALQGGLAASQNDVEDFMPSQVAKGGGVAVAPCKEVLINAQHLWAGGPIAFGRQALEEILEPALDSSAADAFPLSQPAAADAVPVAEEYTTAERFGGALPRQNAGKTLPEAAAAFLATPLAALQFQNAMTQA